MSLSLVPSPSIFSSLSDSSVSSFTPAGKFIRSKKTFLLNKEFTQNQLSVFRFEDSSKKLFDKAVMGQTVSRLAETETETKAAEKIERLPTLRVPLPLSGPNAAPLSIQKVVAEQPWKGMLEPCGELSYTINSVDIEGRIPEELRGTLYRCGAGRNRVGDRKFQHWFDGDGMVYGLALDGPDGEVHFTSKWVQTSKFQNQDKAGSSKIIVKGVWTMPQGIFTRIGIPTNPSNTNIMSFGGRIFSLCEGGPPIEVDPKTLATKGTYDFGLKSYFSAHPKIDPETGVLYNQGLATNSSGGFDVNVFSISPEGVVTSASELITLPLTCLVHDAAISQNYFVMIVPPYVVQQSDVLLSILGVKTMGGSFNFEASRGTRVLIISKKDLSLVKDMTVEAFSTYHFCNAYEENGELHILVNRLNGSRESLEDQFKDMYESNWTTKNLHTIYDLAFDTKTWKLLKNGPAIEPIAGSDPRYGMEFPQVNPNFVGKKNRFTYVLGFRTKEEDDMWKASTGEEGNGFYLRDSKSATYGGMLNCIQKYDHLTRKVETFQLPNQYPSDSDFIPRVGSIEEDDGYLVTFFYEPARHATNVVVLDAKKIGGPPVATIKLPTHVPFYFHGCWAPAA